MKRLIAEMVLLAAPFSAAQAAETVIGTKTFPRADVRAVIVYTGSGRIDVRGSQAGDAKAEALRPAKAKGRCELVVELKDGALTLEAKTPAGARECDAGFRVSAPRSARVEAYAGSGAVAIAGARGEVKARTGSGKVSLDGVEAPAHVLTGSGEVAIKAPKTPWLDVRTGSGRVAVALGREPATVSVRTGSGAIKITAPRGASAKVKVKSASGRVTTELPASGDAKLSIEALTGSGDVTLSIAR